MPYSHPRRSPWPSDIVINKVPYLLGSEKPGEPTMVGTKPQDLTSVVPTDFGPSALNPTFERVQIYDSLELGMGQKIQEASRTRGYRYLIGADQRYTYAIGWDLSVARTMVKGPNIVLVTPATVDTVNGISGFFEIGGNLYASNGRYALKWVSDTSWTVSKDFGVGKKVVDQVVFTTNAGSTTWCYLGLGDTDAAYKFDGTTWTQSVEALYARAWAVVGRNLYRATASTANTVAQVDRDADPWVLANWSNANAYTIGDKTTAIQKLITTSSGALLIFKTDGVYSLDALGNDHNLYANLRGATDVDNGKYATAWLNDVYVSYRDGFFRIKSDFSIEEIGPERLTDNWSVVKGRITAQAGHDTFRLYAGIYNDDTSTSYLMTFRGWTSPQDAEATPVDAWHGSISQAFVGKKITAIYRASTGNFGAPAGHSRMFLGFSDGTIGVFILPCVPSPAACTSYQYYANDATLDLPLATMGFPSDPKAIKAFSVAGTVLDSYDSVVIGYTSVPGGVYQLLQDPSSTVIAPQVGTSAGVNQISYTQLQSYSFAQLAALGIGVFNQMPFQKIVVPPGQSARYLAIQIIGRSAAVTSSPVLHFVDVHYAVRPPIQLNWECLLLADNGLIKRDGSVYRLGSKTIRDNIEAVMNTMAVAVTLPDESTQQLMFTGYEETQAWSNRTRQWHAALKLTAAQNQAATIVGQTGIVGAAGQPGSYGALGKYSYETLSAYTYTQLALLT